MSGKEQVNILLFNKWDTKKIEINDLGLRKVISLAANSSDSNNVR